MKAFTFIPPTLFPLAWRNIWRQPRRSLLTLSAIAFAAFLLIFMIALQIGSYDMSIHNSLRLLTGHFQVQSPGYLDKPQIRNSLQQPQLMANRLRQIPAVKAVAIRASAFALVSSADRSYGAQILGVQSSQEQKLSSIPEQISQGRYLQDQDVDKAVIGEALATNLKLSVGDEITLLGSGRDGSIAATVLIIVGIFQSGSTEIDRGLIQIPLPHFQEVFTLPKQAHYLVGEVKALQQLETLLPQLRQQLQQLNLNSANWQIYDWDTLTPGLKQLIQSDQITSAFLYVCLVLVVTFSILNTFLMAVLERTREFGMLLALGMKAHHISLMVWLESLLLTLLGLLLGLLFGGLLVLYYYYYGFSYPGMEEIGAQFGITGKIYPRLDVLTFAIGPLLVLFFTCLAGLYPALRIYKLKPLQAMNIVF
ncbi:ABC transporter permease [Candidatus Venteria ishoeyi]|uniref:Lipoprotein-releasing system transmembrane protein LolE n=1 Tax=Candidatus Venteria ishoeyi TaxID=1899563 RepID=A0A1H6F949_9GAMM|nr:FtsX-like permease family protein [Candidatus Venteria ishoeyi]SEH06133.1 Lipoprotein-releasing system transmembrane protein LolE [Candidatus Venteria ishoeyi]